MSNPAAVRQPVDLAGADGNSGTLPSVAFFDLSAPRGPLECSHRIPSAMHRGFGGRTELNVESTPT
jgi:hypothetical protein